ncbi:MAG: biotin--[acetyl-CoA-carboxylase] ligase [Deltaproteobacteria bacterium]|nr:biotin--[acetyl-CoA-carboxylase] ligase [Deltaproteobacteria bacterium]
MKPSHDPTAAKEPLSPREIQRALATNRLGKNIHWFESLPSTNVWAQDLAQQGAPEGDIIVAEGQTQGKGRVGRSWISPPYLNLYFSIILRPTLPPSSTPQITLMSAVALAETVQHFLQFSPEIKWPNDILVGGKKLAGILTESHCEPHGVAHVVVGIGVNLNFPKELMPEEIRNMATSFQILKGRTMDRNAFTSRLIQDLDRCYGILEERGFPELADRWESFFALRGRRVKVEMPDGVVQGKAIGIDLDGALILEGASGKRERVLAGDVIPIEL